MGSFCATEGFRASISRTASSLCGSSGIFYDQRPVEKSVVTRGSVSTSPKECIGRISGDSTFQNGDQQVDQNLSPYRDVDVFFRSDGCLFSCPYSSGLSEVSSFGLGGQDLGIVLPPEEKFLKLQYLLDQLLSAKQASARQFLQLIGFLISLMDIVPLGRLHIRPIQWYLLEFWVPASQQWEAVIPILPRLYPHLLWWSVRENVMIGCSLDPPVPSMTLFTDASLTGWGATLEGREASGIWSGLQLTEHINLLEMRAVLLALKQFSQFVQGQSLMIATDNTTVVAYLQNQGGTHSQSLYLLCKEILLFCRSLGIRLSVRHVPGNLNLVADALSRSLHPVNTEWELHPAVFQEICLKWDRPHIDLFATHLNCKLPTFVSPIPDNKALVVDAMSFDWKGMFSYMFPPFRLLPKILHKIRVEICKTILIAPAWPKQSWFPDLLQLCCARPILLPLRKDLLSQFKGRKVHQNLSNLHLHAWLLSGNLSDRMAFLTEQPNVSLVQSENLQEQFMTLSGTSSVLGVVQRKLILSQLLSNS
ncbi:uncharacterized protein LOC130051435 [Ostrea edulis]|uniref:uncharacterized protein LOC130051435 n=1 Tax=Ostrea edulis TaxID=37623 RepID=UPI0024AFE267|nr:uncharacterized protein LOC130051435 [Ostrea edulis]